jgi:23S rRNA pseudouridine2605 synthase
MSHECSALVPLNKFIAQAGICSRRKAVELIDDGLIKVNNAVIKEPGFRVCADDKVIYRGKRIAPEAPVYYILNKPRHFVTTCADDQGRPTVLHCFPPSIRERLFPVGRLDTETTGVLLLTNDGDVAQRLAHPRYEVKKTYMVTLDRALTADHMEIMLRGIKLEDGFVKVDSMSTHAQNPCGVRVTLHSGKNRIIKRIFELFGYHVKKLDRREYAGLTPKGLQSGGWRQLTHTEIKMLYKRAELL